MQLGTARVDPHVGNFLTDQDGRAEVSWNTGQPPRRTVVAEHGPEALAVSTSGWNTQSTHGLDRRFMNLLGSPNWISGVSLCAGNTAAVNRLTYGWMPFPDIGNASCIVLLGHNPRKHSWTPIFNMIEGARKRGAQTIVVDPRVSEQAESATLHLQIKAGTDAALLLGWTKVIIDEGLYDKDFVRDWCVGFEELSQRVAEYPLERVAEASVRDRVGTGERITGFGYRAYRVRDPRAGVLGGAVERLFPGGRATDAYLRGRARGRLDGPRARTDRGGSPGSPARGECGRADRPR